MSTRRPAACCCSSRSSSTDSCDSAGGAGEGQEKGVGGMWCVCMGRREAGGAAAENGSVHAPQMQLKTTSLYLLGAAVPPAASHVGHRRAQSICELTGAGGALAQPCRLGQRHCRWIWIVMRQGRVLCRPRFLIATQPPRPPAAVHGKHAAEASMQRTQQHPPSHPPTHPPTWDAVGFVREGVQRLVVHLPALVQKLLQARRSVISE